MCKKYINFLFKIYYAFITYGRSKPLPYALCTIFVLRKMDQFVRELSQFDAEGVLSERRRTGYGREA